MKRKFINIIMIMFTILLTVNLPYNGALGSLSVYAVEDDEITESDESKKEKLSDDEGVMLSLPKIPELTDEYKIIEKYETTWSSTLSYDIKYDKYDAFPHYVVNLSSYKRKIYEEPDTDTKVLKKIYYGTKYQTIALIEDDKDEKWYAVVFEDDDEAIIGYVREEKVSKREFQIDEMNKYLENVAGFDQLGHIVYVENYKYKNGYPPRMPNRSYYDDYGYRRGQSIAGYYDSTMDGEFRYIQDGMLGVVEQVVETTETVDDIIVIDSKGHFTDRDELSEYFDVEESTETKEPVTEDDEDEISPLDKYNEISEVTAVKLFVPSFGVSLWVEEKYLNEDKKSPDVLDQAIIVDRENQNIVVFEHDDEWKVVSMSYSSTGKVGEYSLPTPLGYYMAITRKPKFDYVQDGTSTIVGFAPYAIRFSGGGYLHGVPMSYTFDETGKKHSPSRYAEYLSSIGTIPKSHMCVRNYTSHAEFMYDWVDIGNCAVIVIE